jgi:hypothetical protein
MSPHVQIIASLVVVLPVLAGLNSRALSQDSDPGQANFIANCAECHGIDGRGTGPRSAELKTKPADLTLLAKKNNGVFDPGAVFQIIDGRKPGSRTHLSKEMPIWGCRHETTPTVRRRIPKHQRYLPPPVTHKSDKSTEFESLVDLPCDSAAAVQDRILSIVGYLSHIQR